MKTICRFCGMALLFLCAALNPLHAQKQQAAVDTLLFTIPLVDDSGSLFYCDWSDDLRRSLAGPVRMADNSLLFHSQNGYAVYNINGKLLEEHSLVKDNAKAGGAKKPRMYLAYPFDGETLIYYTDSDTVEVFRKKLYKKGLDKVSASEMEMFKDIKQHEPLNIYRSGTTEDVGRKTFLKPHLAGFTALEGGSKWWTIDMFFSFTSPLIMETNNKFTSFFPGLREGGGHCDVPVKMVEPLGVFSREGRWYYLGLYSVTGSKEDEYFQTIVLCDQAGNILYCNQLLKQGITDAVLQERIDIKTVFTVRKAGRHVFAPSVDAHGDIFYGVINWEWKKIEVYKRSFIRFLPSPTAPALADRFAEEEGISFLPVKIECSNASRRGVIPEVVSKDKQGMNLLDLKELTRDSFYVKVHRLPDEDLKRKLSRVIHTMPKNIGAMQDSISKLPTTWCPYGISLNHANESKGTLSNLDYGFGDVVVCARVLGKSSTKNIYVRVDLEDWAEVVVFTPEGRFLERFTFNNTHYKERRDIVALSTKDEVYERDYEFGAANKKKSGFRFVVWRKAIRPLNDTAVSQKDSKKKKK